MCIVKGINIMSFFFEGNGYFSWSYLVNSTIQNNIITTSAISTSTIDMLDTAGNYQNITNAAMPINDNDVAIKLYVDNLGIRINNYNLSGTQGVTISSDVKGCFVVTVTNLVLNGPCAVFNISKNEQTVTGHIVRNSMAPGLSSLTKLNMKWPIGSGPILYKTDNNYDGSYRVKIM